MLFYTRYYLWVYFDLVITYEHKHYQLLSKFYFQHADKVNDFFVVSYTTKFLRRWTVIVVGRNTKVNTQLLLLLS